MKSERNTLALVTATCLVRTGCGEPDVSISAVVSQKVGSGAVDTVLPNTLCNEYPQGKTARSRSGIGFKGANGSHINHHWQRRFRVKTSAVSNRNTTWEVADVRKLLVSASRLLERRHKLV